MSITTPQLVDEIARLRDIIRRARAQFCADGSDGATAAKMLANAGVL